MKLLLCFALMALTLAACTATQQGQFEEVMFKVADVTAQVAAVAATVEEIKEDEEGGFTGEGGVADLVAGAAAAAALLAGTVKTTNVMRDKKRLVRGEKV